MSRVKSRTFVEAVRVGKAKWDDLVETKVANDLWGCGTVSSIERRSSQDALIVVRFEKKSARFNATTFEAQAFAIELPDPQQVRRASLFLSGEMIAAALLTKQMDRTEASKIGSNIVGALGEFAFAEIYLGNWREHQPDTRHGRVDFGGERENGIWVGGVEVKTSACPLSANRLLFVRADYVTNRHPSAYVQVNIDVPSGTSVIPVRTRASLLGFATHDEVLACDIRDDFGAPCYQVPIVSLHRMELLPWPLIRLATP